MTNLGKDPNPPHEPADRWAPSRVGVAGVCGAMFSESNWVLDFWPLAAGGSPEGAARAFFDLSRIFFLLPLAGFVVGLFIATGVALWCRHFRRMASSIFAIAAIPVCILVVAKLPLCDPWLWYAMVNSGSFENLAERLSPADGPKYAVIKESDVSVGFAGLNPNHFVLLIYDETDNAGLDPSDRPNNWPARTVGPLRVSVPPLPKGRRLFGHFFRVDEFE